jgi:hypothetical protein
MTLRSSFLGSTRKPLLLGRLQWLALATLLELTACNRPSQPSVEEQAAKKQPAAEKKEASQTAAPPKTKVVGEKPSAKEARTITEALPSEDKVRQVVNANNHKPYDGPTGTIAGVVKASGDANLELPEALAKMDQNCTTSRRTFGYALREGQGRTLADVLVAVTEYTGFIPEKEEEVVVIGEGCAWNARTVAMTYGQYLSVIGKDNRPYVPELLGQKMPAQLFVLPTAPPVKIPPQKPGRYVLVDSMRLYNKAEVFVLPYATHDVTGVDGRFTIEGVPVGKVRVNALLPQTMEVVEKQIEVKEGKTTELEFSLPFSAAKYKKINSGPGLEALPSP